MVLFEVGRHCGNAFGSRRLKRREDSGTAAGVLSSKCQPLLAETGVHLLPDLEVEMSGELEVA